MIENNYSVILCCSCFRMDKKALEAFSVLFPDKAAPDIIKGRDRIAKFAQTTNNNHIKAISRLSGKFAYYTRLQNNSVIEEWDLVKRSRIA